MAVNENATLSLGYGGLLSQNHQDNSVNAGFTGASKHKHHRFNPCTGTVCGRFLFTSC
ncbi:hypothetical protein M8494_31290 [Serratia ureilytica]